jgi:hypothetical protein
MSSIVPRPGETVSSTYNPSLPLDHSLSPDLRRAQSPSTFAQSLLPEKKEEIECLKKELDSRDSTITELKNQLKNLQTIVEQLTKENSVLKTNSVDDDQSIASQASINDSLASNVVDGACRPPERGRSLETEQLTLSEEEADLRHSLKATQRPVSMFEPREGPKNNWQVTKHQVLISINYTNLDFYLVLIFDKNKKGSVSPKWTYQISLDQLVSEELDGPAVSALLRAIAEVKQRWSVIGWVTKKMIISSFSVFRKAR